MYLLSFSWRAQKALWELIETGMDMADAALVRVADREGIRRVLTLDQRDFSVYRLARKGSFTLLP